MHQRAAEADFLLHAARELAAWPISERVESRGFQQVVDARATLSRALTEQAAEEVDVVEHAQRRIEIAAQPLRHVGNAAVTRPAMVLIRHVAVEHNDFAGLNLAHASDKGEQGGLADAVGPNQSRHAPARNLEGEVVQRELISVAVRATCSMLATRGLVIAEASPQARRAS